MLRLASKTDPGWARTALSDVPALLADHAHCEKKAAASALSLITSYPEDGGLAQPLARLAQEENRHFFRVMDELSRRGLMLSRDSGDAYAAGLLAAAASSGQERRRDRLLICALIEARSCERFGLLAEAAPLLDEPRLAKLYGSLFEAEARHHALFFDLCLERFEEGPTRARLAELQTVEAELVARLPHRAAIH